MRTSQLHQLVKNKATETPHGVYYIHFSHSPLHLFAKELMVGTIIHIRGAFSVARFDLQGNAKAFRMWNELQDWLHVFCACMHTIFFINRQEGAIGKKTSKDEKIIYYEMHAHRSVYGNEYGCKCRSHCV